MAASLNPVRKYIKARLGYAALPDVSIPVTVVGRFYKPSGCTCVLPAWELCEPNCKHGLPVPWDPLEDAKRFNTDFR